MALYISAARRRRRIVVTAALTLVLGLVAGVVFGRQMVESPAERARAVAAAGRDLATRVDALTIEYEQAVGGGGDSVAKGVSEPLAGIDHDLRSVLSSAPWIGAKARAGLLAKVEELRRDATSGMSAPGFESATAEASGLIRSALVGG
jgi:hydrogenase/urease accessory protein HupE